MPKKSFIVLFMSFLFFSATGQNQTDSIHVVKVFSGIRYEQSGRILKFQDLEFIMNHDKAAYNYLKKSKSLYVFSSIISGCGGGLIGYPIGYGISTGYYNLSLIVVGCGLVIVSIPISIACDNKIRTAVDTYNSKFNRTGSIDKLDMRFGFTQNGIGLTITL